MAPDNLETARWCQVSTESVLSGLVILSAEATYSLGAPLYIHTAKEPALLVELTGRLSKTTHCSPLYLSHVSTVKSPSN